MAVTTLKGHVSRALDFYNKPDIYVGIGKTTPKFYLSMSCRGFGEGYGQSVAGIFEFEPTTQTLKMTGQLLCGK